MIPRPNFRDLFQLGLAFVVFAWWGQGGYAEEPAKALPGEAIDFRKLPEFQKLVSGRFDEPTAADLLKSLRDQSGVNLTLDPAIVVDRPLQGPTNFQKVALWVPMQMFAENKFIQGQWRKVGDEYRLCTTLPAQPKEGVVAKAKMILPRWKMPQMANIELLLPPPEPMPGVPIPKGGKGYHVGALVTVP